MFHFFYITFARGICWMFLEWMSERMSEWIIHSTPFIWNSRYILPVLSTLLGDAYLYTPIHILSSAVQQIIAEFSTKGHTPPEGQSVISGDAVWKPLLNSLEQ